MITLNKLNIIVILILLFTNLFIGCSTKLFENKNADYDFRKVRWGYTREHIATIEQGNTVYLRTPETLIYRRIIDNIPVLLVYCFEKNKLRVAGYITQKPVLNTQNLVQNSIKKYGMPLHQLSSGLMWELPRSMIYVDVSKSYTKIRNTRYRKSPGALELFMEKHSEDELGHKVHMDGVLTYVDRNFYKDLSEKEFPLLELSYYEKRLLGILTRGTNVRVRTLSGEEIEIPTNVRVRTLSGEEIEIPIK